MSYVSKFSTRRFNIILIKFLSKILSIIDLNLELVPYSNWSSSIFLIYKKQNKKSFRLQKQNYFNSNSNNINIIVCIYIICLWNHFK